MWAPKVSLMVLAAGALFAQHAYAPTDIEEGRLRFQTACAVCHGLDGDSVPGVDLMHGKFRRAQSEGELVHIIQAGIPGTAMPPSNFSEFQAGTIAAYLRSMATVAGNPAASGDGARGMGIFEGKGGCLSCHRVKGNGSRLGPELTDIGANHRVGELEQSLLDPDAIVLPQNRFFRVVTKDGATVTGRLLNQDAFTVQLFDSTERLRSFSKADLKEYSFVEKSPMPSYRDKLSAQELEDVVSYLASLKGIDKQ